MTLMHISLMVAIVLCVVMGWIDDRKDG